MAKEIIHYDILGTQIKLGDYVAYVDMERIMHVGVVSKLHRIMIGVGPCRLPPEENYYSNYYPKNVVILDGPKLTMYLLKK